MSETKTKYLVKVIREQGNDPVTGRQYDYAEQELLIEADDTQSAHSKANQQCTLRFSGQIRRTFINGKEHFDKKL